MSYTPPSRRPFTRSQTERMRSVVFIKLAAAELQRFYWRQRVFDVEISTGHADADGYDLIVTRGDIVRHVALLTRPHDRRVEDVWISEKLAQLPSACVIQLVVDDDLKIVEWHWFGAGPGEPLPEGSKRPRIRRRAPDHPDAPPETTFKRQPPPPGMRELRFVDFQWFEGSDCLDWVAHGLIGPFHAPDDVEVALKDVAWRGQRYEGWDALKHALMENRDCTVSAELNETSDHGSIKVKWGDSNWVSYILRLDADGLWSLDDTPHFGVHGA